jgi:hypothetical protein
LLAWALWVLASAIGGAVGGSSFVLDVLGAIVLFGAIFGAVQAPIIKRYLLSWGAVFWIAASFLGWFSGWLVLAVAQGLLGGVLEGLALELVGSRELAGQTLPVLLWATLGAFQAFVLRKGLPPSSRSLAAPWALAGVMGGALAVTAGFFSDVTQSLELIGADSLLTNAAVMAAAGAIYGAATGVVLAMIARRSAN